MGGRESEGRRREEREGGKESGVRVAEEEVDGSFWRLWGLWGLWGHDEGRSVCLGRTFTQTYYCIVLVQYKTCTLCNTYTTYLCNTYKDYKSHGTLCMRPKSRTPGDICSLTTYICSKW